MIQLGMRLRAAHLFLLAFSYAPLAACEDDADFDTESPRVVSWAPAEVMQPRDSITLVFSEVLNDKTLQLDPEGEPTVAMVRTVDDDPALRDDLDGPPLRRAHRDKLVPLSATLSEVEGRTVLRIDPVKPWEPGTTYSLFLSSRIRDASGNPLVDATGALQALRFFFTSDGAPPVILDVDGHPADEAGPLLPPNRKRLRLRFSKPVEGVDSDSLRLVPETPGAFIPLVESTVVDETQTEATLTFGVTEGCLRLAANATYRVESTPDVLDSEGHPLAPSSARIQIGEGCDLVDNRILDVRVRASDTRGVVRVVTSKPSELTVRFGYEGQPRNANALVTRDAVVVPGTNPPVYESSVTVAGLVMGLRTEVDIQAEDDVGHTAKAQTTIDAAPPTEVVVNEVLFDAPHGLAHEAEAEFVELASLAEQPLDLAGLKLEVDGGKEAGGRTCSLPAATLQPGGFLLVVGTRFVAGALDERALVRMPTTQVCGALANDRAQSIALTDATGRVLSELVFPGRQREGRSVERLDPRAADGLESFCLSRVDRGPTPATANGTALHGCEP